MVFPTLFNLSLILQQGAHDLSHSQPPGLDFADCIVSPFSTAKNVINLVAVLTI